MAAPGRIQRRLALAIVLTALIPVLVAILMGQYQVRTTAARFFVPDVGRRLEQSLGLYQELARAVKARMRADARAMASDERLRAAARAKDKAALLRELDRVFPEHSGLVSLTVQDDEGETLAVRDRGKPLDAEHENALSVPLPLAADPAPKADDDDAPDAAQLIAVFAADKARFDELGAMSEFVETYKQIETQRESDVARYLYAFAALLGITIVAAVGVGTLLARGISSRLGGLAAATQRVGAGDLQTRVPERGNDEIADLARGFNSMLGEVQQSRARIEYLQRIGAWQEMARRLAHEIKNPLTPIQLAAQEMHRRYPGDDSAYKTLLDSTLEIVEDEVATLRRLVTEFSNFARLPQAELAEGDLFELLREQRGRLELLDESGSDLADENVMAVPARPLGVRLEFDVPEGPAVAYMDRQMLSRALVNLVRNAAQAVSGTGRTDGVVRISSRRDGDFWVVDVDDDGPGIPEPMRESVFDPYVTTKTDGTGLGLAIVKKILVEHGGTITAEHGSLGGARMRLRLPAAGTGVGRAALEARGRPASSDRPSRAPASR